MEPTVERLDCKWPILWLAYIDPPPPPGECVPPAFGEGGGGVPLAGWKGVVGQYFGNARHSSVLYVCKYFVEPTLYAPRKEGGASNRHIIAENTFRR
jgi:hypothetical protein